MHENLHGSISGQSDRMDGSALMEENRDVLYDDTDKRQDEGAWIVNMKRG